jgi:hypothetical protein
VNVMTSGDQPELLDYESPSVLPRWRRRKFIVAAAITAVLLLAVIHASRPRPLSIPPVLVAVAPAPATNDVSRALFMLLNNKDITSEVFSCPTTQPSHWEFDAGSTTASATAPTTSPNFVLLRTPIIAGPQPFVSPSQNQEKWDFGGGANTALNWTNWNGATSQPTTLSDPFRDSYPGDITAGK